MKRFGWLLLGLPLAWAVSLPAQAADSGEGKKTVGIGQAYERLGKLPVMHAGRKKPYDTVAREEVKQIFGRETITLHDDANQVVGAWGPIGAAFDWAVNPEFWDDQPFILTEYLPLKRVILADVIKARLDAAAARPGTSEADRSALKALAADRKLVPASLERFLATSKVTDEDRKAIESLAAMLTESHKWFTPRQLETAEVTVDGQRLKFDTWFRDLARKKGEGEGNVTQNAPKLTDVEKRAIEVGTRLAHYQAVRDRSIRSIEPLLVMPHPSNPSFLKFGTAALRKAKEKGSESLTLLELDSANLLWGYLNDLPSDEWETPGENKQFDDKFMTWIRKSSVWVPLRVLLDSKPEDLEQAGFPTKATSEFLAAYREVEKAEADSPGLIAVAKSDNLLTKARALGVELSTETYPTTKAMDLEAHFNATNPFFRAPYGYGAALALLAVSLLFVAVKKPSPVWWIGTVVYAGGLLGLIAGIALEVQGFVMRVRISGWAPVTNMYETVIWVSLVSAVLGLVFELIYRKRFAALAGSGVALLGTVLAANTPLLDPGIRTLTPVLRSNYWLAIHVLTEVSSYAAFALAMGLGMIATLYYLTATYRRSPSYIEVGAPAVPGLPMLAIGAFGIAASYGELGVDLPNDRATMLYYVASALAAVGGILSIVGVGGLLGEFVSRVTFRDTPPGEDSDGTDHGHYTPPATSVQTVTIGEQDTGAVATLTKPTVAEIRARAAQNRPKLDARGLAMQATAAKIKPLSNFIYRTMQVGVLLIAAGTILGGIWADYSWGRFWGWDPKEVWALITLLIYLIPLHGRFAGWVNTFGLVMSSVACFLSVIMAWYGVNFVLGVGLHSYGFVEGGSQGVVGAVVLAVLSVAAAAAWRRSLASRPAK